MRTEDARDLERSGRLEESLNAHRKLLLEFPDNPLSLHFASSLESDLGLDSEAIDHARQLVAMNPQAEIGSLTLFFALEAPMQYKDAFDEMFRFLAVGKSAHYDEMIQDLLNDPTMKSHELWDYFRDGLKRLGRLPLEYQ
ncbi:MAG: hypothetical protein WC655_11825 [Candidatus Hydrogenedentales bacterium]